MLTSCLTTAQTTTTPTRTNLLTPTSAITPIRASATPSLTLPALTPKTSNTPISTITRVPMWRPTLTPVVVPDTYNLPRWMANSQARILIGVSDRLNGYFQLSFFNAESNERFDLLLPKYIRGYFWLDNMHFGFLNEDSLSVYLVNIGNGKVTKYPISIDATKDFNDTSDRSPPIAPVALIAVGDSLSDPSFSFNYPYPPENKNLLPADNKMFRSAITEIEKEHLTGKYLSEEIALPSWSTDKKQLFYTYAAFDLSIDGNYLGKFCIYTVSNKKIICSTESIPELKGNTITDYALSSDELYVVLHFECRMLSEDSVCIPQNGLMRIDGSGFQLLGNPELSWKQITGEVNFHLDNYDTPYAFLWRPLPD